MNAKIILVIVTTGSFLALTGPARGQEVNSDVKIPLPREIVTTAPAVPGLVAGTDPVLGSGAQVFQGALADAATGILNEAGARGELGDFMTSLLVRAEVIAFDRGPAALAASGEDSADGSRPAWAGRTPLALSVRRAGRPETGRRR